jgi:predicted dienelactone hydrolase
MKLRKASMPTEHKWETRPKFAVVFTGLGTGNRNVIAVFGSHYWAEHFINHVASKDVMEIMEIVYD